ncbi:MAG: hypothetical protein ACYTFW_02440 [Planctomycetota bacterium]|jgi:hypothetical protein
MSDYPQITYRKHTFLSALALGISTLAITLVISCTVLIIYGMNFAGDQSEKIVSLAENAVRGLPDLQESLPPVLADLLNDRRQPDYRTQLDISAKTILLPDQNGMVRTTVDVVNNGNEVVSLLSLRVVVLTANDEILVESNEWAATPIAADHDWRGPLMPGSQRYFTSSHSRLPVFSLSDLKTEVEITDIRIWNSPKETSLIDSEISSATDKSGYPPIEFTENE